jgi:signal transduction histidine kinase
MRSVVELIPSAYQYPEMTCARVVIDRQQFKTANFRKTRWGQRAQIFAYGKSAGKLEVCYLSEVPKADEGPFLREERDLIRMIAENLGRMVERKQAEEERQAYQQHLQSLASDLLFTEERERRRFAIDLHDSIGQVLAMTKLKLDMLQAQMESAKLAGDLDEARQFVGQAIQQARSLTFELSPPVLYEVGLEAALEDLVERIEERHGLRINFTDDRRPKPVGEDLRIYLFRAVRELLVNIVKHANARSVKVAVGRRDDEIRIEVADDGVGFEASDLNSHMSRGGKFGLFSIKERLQHLGGHLEIVSGPEEGTKVILLAPVKINEVQGS